MIQQLINDEKFTNIQTAQAGLTKIFIDAQKTGTFYRVLKNDQPLGVLIPNDLWQSIVEDLEALSSPSYKIKINKARKEKTTIKSSEIKKQLGI
jgi:PHD/YefM family antitoxin component YafN of YafNO toxin-antitoxin module